MQGNEIIDQFRIRYPPNYIHQGNEEEVFRHAFDARIPLILKGPTGCGKTRFMEYMAHRLDLPLVTVSCHEDLTAADLVGRYLFKDDETVWQDGPLTLAVRCRIHWRQRSIGIRICSFTSHISKGEVCWFLMR